MARDVRYQLLIDGEADEQLTAEAAEIQVMETIEGPTTFSIRFATDVCGGDLASINDPRLTPSDSDNLVSVVTVVDGETSCIAHGIITRRRGSIVDGGPGSWLEISCSDRRAVMDREQRVDHHSGKASEAVHKILSNYNFDLDIEETTVEYREDDHLLAQVESDLAFVSSVAGQNDFHFWLDFAVSSGPFGPPEITETAHFKPSPPRPEDAPLGVIPVLHAPDDTIALKLNSGDGCSNVFSFEFDDDVEVPNQTGTITRVDFDSAEEDDTTIPSPTTDPLGTETQPSQTRTRRIVTAGSIEEAQIVNRAALNDASWAISAHAETSVHALGGLVHAHDVIKVTGTGSVAAGSYFVKSVMHHINPADHKLSIELLRNAFGE